MRNLLLLTLMVGIIGLTNCKKDRTETVVKEVYQSPQSYFDSHKQNEQEFVITGPGTEPIVGEQGTKIYQSKDIFTYPNGDTISYPYTIKLVELYTPADMVYYGVFPVSDGNMLTTAGELRIRAFKDNQELVLRPGYSYKVLFPTDENNMPLYLYRGIDDGNGNINWSNTNTLATYVQDSAANVSGYYYQFFSQFLNWINCDRFNNVTLTTITFDSETDSVETIPKFLYLPDYDGVMEVLGKTAQVPANTQVKFLALGLNTDGDLYYYYQEFTSTPGTVINITMAQTTDAYVTQLLESWGQ